MEMKKSRIDYTNEGMVIDRISHLPDSILSHILSFLPTENAVATSILSKRWKFTWSMVHNLHFSYYVHDGEPAEFVRFVDRVLLLHDGGSINKFSLSWVSNTRLLLVISSHVISWINYAITRHVQTLYLSIDSDQVIDIPISGFSCDTLRSLELCGIRISIVCDSTTAAASVCLPRLESLKLDSVYCASKKACEQLISGCPVLQDLYLDIYPIDDEEEWGMPSNVFSCESLQSLEMCRYLQVPAAIVVCCTRLETLKLKNVSFESEEACEKLISGCPVLQYLHLRIFISSDGDDDDDDDIFTCIISSASLRHLNIYFENESSLKLNASSLESFEVDGFIHDISVEKNLRSLVKAGFRIRFNVERGSVNNSNNSFVEAISAFHCAKVLTLSRNVVWALSHATISFSTEFNRLVKFVAETCCISIQDVIQNSNNLEDLTIYQHAVGRHDHPKWTTPVEVPRCLSNSLKSFHFHGYNGSEDERRIIRYILEHGSALKVMRISCYYKKDAEKLKLIQEICVFPRKSTVCEVHFSW